MTPAERRREVAIERAKLALGFGWDSLPCDICACRLTRKYAGKVRCWFHYDGPLQLGLVT